MTPTNKNFGFKPSIINRTHYFLGASAVPQVVLQPEGDWENCLPDYEAQFKNGVETFNCIGEGLTNTVEIMHFELFGERVNFSDRWVGIISGTKEGGNDPQTVYEAVRKYGLIPESMLPFSSDITSIEEYYSFKGADKDACYAAGKAWLAKYDFFHEWVFDADQPADEKLNNMKVALHYSPIAFSVFAWQADSRGVYVKAGEENHWTTIYSIKQFEQIFDSYEPYKKLLEQDSSYCKRIHLALKTPEENKTYWFVDIATRLLVASKDALLLLLQVLNMKKDPTVIELLPQKPVQSPSAVPPALDFSTPEAAHHSTRVLADELGMTLKEKDDFCKVMRCESGFNNKLTHPNYIEKLNKETGIKEKILASTDYGLCQINDKYHIGAGKDFPSVDYVMNNPEICARWAIKLCLAGQWDLWVCHKKGLYLKEQP